MWNATPWANGFWPQSEGCLGVVGEAAAAEARDPGASIEQKSRLSRSLWQAGQDEGVVTVVNLALAQRKSSGSGARAQGGRQ